MNDVQLSLGIDKDVGLSLGSCAVHLGTDSAPVYGGPYEVTPRVAAQTLETHGHVMSRDVDVRGIPEYAVSNDAGGYTINIG